MIEHVIIDGNNLLFAMHAHAPVANVGRETLVRTIERWAAKRPVQVTVVFDGPVPRKGLASQMSHGPLKIQFSAQLTADDIIIAHIQGAKHPEMLRIVTSDTAIKKEASHRRSRRVESAAFVDELYAAPPAPTRQRPLPDDKATEDPRQGTEEKIDTAAWLKAFGFEEDDPDSFDGHDAMIQ